MFEVTAGRHRFGFGDALQATFDAVGSNFGPMYLLAVLLVGLPYFLVQSAVGYFGILIRTSPTAIGPLLLTELVGLGVYLASNIMLQAALSRLVVTYLNGGRPKTVECLLSIVRLILPLIGISIVAFFGILAGSLVLVVPGIFLAIAWSLAAPVEVVERRGVFGSLGRSFGLTRDHRWKMVGVYLIIAVVNLVTLIAGGALAAILMTSVGSLIHFNLIGLLIMRGLVTGLTISLGAVLGSASAASLYVGIRQLKEGATPKSLAAVFD
jgi:hypothetical protein